jgi:hypothetical protein
MSMEDYGTYNILKIYIKVVFLQQKSPAVKAGLFMLLVETAGIEPASASTLQIVLHT